MKILKIPTDRGFMMVSDQEEAKFVNPIEYYEDAFMSMRITVTRESYLAHDPNVNEEILNKLLIAKYSAEWKRELKNLKNTKIPRGLLNVLELGSKKEQIKSLKGVRINADQLTAFIIKSHLEFGYKFSSFSKEHLHNGLENEIIPHLIHLDGNNVRKEGKTTLSEGQLKQLMTHRKVVVAKFIDLPKNWHCLFLTYKSINGEESWKNGQPHFHYISDKFGLDREYVETQLKSKFYKLNSLPHIDLINYRKEK